MANDIITTSEADGQLALAQKVLSLPPSKTSDLAAALGDEAPACIEAAIAKIEHDLRPVPSVEAEREHWRTAIDQHLRRLAVKVLPTAKPADTDEWRKAMADALSDLPAMVSITAAKRAIHKPFRFIGEIEVEVRVIAAELLAKRRARLSLLRLHRAEIERALAPQSALPAPDPAPVPTAEEVAKLNDVMARFGLGTRFSDDGSPYQASSVALPESSAYVPHEEAA